MSAAATSDLESRIFLVRSERHAEMGSMGKSFWDVFE